MDSYIRLYEDRVPVNKCQEMINLFEQDTANHQIQDCGGGATLTQVNMLHSKDTPWREYANFLVNVIMNCVEDYRKDCHIQSHHFPTAFGFEPPKIKRYLPDTTDEFPNHVDVLDYKTARRFLVAFIYLDDNDNGETIVNPKDDLFVSSCNSGSVLLFPPFFTHPHTGKKPVDKPKYIAGSYLHYSP